MRTRRPPSRLSSIADLKQDPRNARRHGERNRAAIEQSFREVGAARSVVIDEDDVLLAGNASQEAAIAAGLTKLKVVDVDGDTLVAVRRTGLTPAQKARLALLDNRTAELAEGWDAGVLEELKAAGVPLADLWSEKELAVLLRSAATTAGLTDPDTTPELRATDVRAGDIVALGRHRLVCGDATDPRVVEALLDGHRPSLMVTDPPYGVEYDPAWRARAGINRNRKKLGAVLNDDRADWTPAWKLFPGHIAYVYHAGLKTSLIEQSLQSADFELRSQIIWAKDRLVLSRGDYHWQHETCWYAVRGRGDRTDDRSQTSLWRIPTPDAWKGEVPVGATKIWEIPARDDAGGGHGTQKPVECMARPMRNHICDEVYDPFLGSGTSCIAAEMQGVSLFAIELNPTYVQQAIDRWEAFTGAKATQAGRCPER